MMMMMIKEFHQKVEITSTGKNAEKGEPSCPVGGNVNECSHSGKQNGGSSEN